MGYHHYLSAIRITSILILLIAAAFFAMGSGYVLPVIFLIVDLMVCRFHRCPFCKQYLEMRAPLRELQHCNHCGKKIDVYVNRTGDKREYW